MLVAGSVASAHFHIKNSSERIAILGRESPCKKIGIANHLIAKKRHQSAPDNVPPRKMLRRRDFHAFQSPLHALWGITAHNNRVVLQITRRDPRKSRRQTRRVTKSAGIALCFLYRKGASTHGSHCIEGFLLADTRYYLHAFKLSGGFFQSDTEHDFFG